MIKLFAAAAGSSLGSFAIGMAVLVVPVLVFIAIIAFWWWKKTRAARSPYSPATPSAPASAPAGMQTTATPAKSGGWLKALLALAIFGAVIYWFGNKMYEAEMASRGGSNQANVSNNATCAGDPVEIVFGPGRPNKVTYTMRGKECWSPWFNAEAFDKFSIEGVDNKGYYIRFFRDGHTEWVPPYDGTNCVWFGSQDTALPGCKLVGNHGNRFKIRGEGPLIVWVEEPLFTKPAPNPTSSPEPTPTPEPVSPTPITE